MKHLQRYFDVNTHISFLAGALALIFLFSTISMSKAQKADNPDFEGIIEYKVSPDASSRQGSQTLTYMARGNQGRIEFVMESGRKIAVLVDSKQQKVTMLMEQAQAYMEFPLNQVSEEGGQTDPNQPQLQKTNRTSSIAGKECQIWRVEDGKQTIDMCVASGMGNFLLPGTNIPSQMGPLQVQRRPEWFQEAMSRGFMPLKIDVTENDETKTVLEAQTIQEKSLSSSLFTVPSEYQNMNQMMRQMMQGQGR